MIHSIKIKNTNSLLNKLWGEREFIFKDINIIFGENGTGKSVLLDTIAKYVAIDARGWSSGLTPSRIKNHKNKSYIEAINDSSNYGIIDINWDGVACYLSDTSRNTSNSVNNLMSGNNNEELSFSESLIMSKKGHSSGEQVRVMINRLVNLKVPDLKIPVNSEANDTWKNAGELLSNYVKNLPTNGKPTLLMDEPDKSLDFNSQAVFWNLILKELAKKYQLIIITHSVFALGNKDWNIIDKNNYYETSNESVRKFLLQ